MGGVGPAPEPGMLLGLVGIPVLAGGIFMIYNMLRFSGPLDFGGKWQLGGRDVRNIAYDDLANLPPSLYGYLVAPLRLGLGFPYFQLPPPPSAPFSGPRGFYGEPTASVLWAVPFALLSIPVLLRGRLRRHARRAEAPTARRLHQTVAALLLVAVAGLLPGAYSIPGYTERYELDFLPYLVMAATLAWAELIRGASSARRAAWWWRGGMALAAWSMLVGVAIGFTGYYDSLKWYDSDRFRALERAFSPLPVLATAIGGGPAIASVSAPGGVADLDARYTKLNWDGVAFRLAPGAGDAALTIVSPGARDAALRFEGRPGGDGGVAVPPSVVQAGAGPITSVAVAGDGAVSLPLRLKRGVNYVTLSADGGAVVLRDVRVR